MSCEWATFTSRVAISGHSVMSTLIKTEFPISRKLDDLFGSILMALA
jgi:hypothetical protein